MATTRPTLVIPNQYTQPQMDIARRRKLADAMLAQGLATRNDMTSWAQVLGQLAQAWVGKSLDKQATKDEAALNDRIQADYAARLGGFQTDSHSLNPQAMVEKYAADPIMQDALKPYSDAYAAGLKQREDLVNFGGKMVRRGDVVGQYDNDPNKMVFVNPDGQMSINPVAITAAGISNGTLVPEIGYQTTAPMPGMEKLVGAMSGQPASLSPEQGGAILGSAAKTSVISGTDALRVSKSLGPNGQSAFAKWVADNGIKIHVSSPQEASQLPSGTIITLPDGTEGRVP